MKKITTLVAVLALLSFNVANAQPCSNTVIEDPVQVTSTQLTYVGYGIGPSAIAYGAEVKIAKGNRAAAFNNVFETPLGVSCMSWVGVVTVDPSSYGENTRITVRFYQKMQDGSRLYNVNEVTYMINRHPALRTRQVEIEDGMALLEKIEAAASVTPFRISADRFPEPKEVAEISVYPNPAVEKVSFSNPDNADFTVTLFNQMGQKVASVTANGQEVIFNLQGFAAGMYTYTIVMDADKTEIQAGKFIKE